MKKIRLTIMLLLVSSIAVAGPQRTSSTTASDIISKARVYLDEPTVLQWSQADLLRFVNDGSVDIASKAKCYQAKETITLTSATSEYTPTSDYISIVAVLLNQATGGTVRLAHSNISSIGSVASSGTSTRPGWWYEFAGKLGIFPAYATVTTQTLSVYLAKRPAKIGIYESILIPAVFDRALIYYVVSQAFMSDSRMSEATNFLNLYLSEIDRYRQDFVGADNETADPVH